MKKDKQQMNSKEKVEDTKKDDIKKDDADKENKPNDTANEAKKEEPKSSDKKAEEASSEKKLLEQLKSEKNDLNDKLLRVVAEYDNYRKRTQKEKSAIYPQAVADTVEKLLPIIDTFERAMQSECSDKEFLKGVEMTYNSFMNIMKELSVEPIGKVGETFNPDFHNAVSHIDDEKLGENVVSVVMQKGYKIGDKIVRYAMVQVAN